LHPKFASHQVANSHHRVFDVVDVLRVIKRFFLDYRLLDGATVGDREFLYVYDAANARIIAFQRADGGFVRQWLAPSSGPMSSLLDDVRGLHVTSATDGPPAAYVLTPEGIVRLVLE
jgi:hypothetical protein